MSEAKRRRGRPRNPPIPEHLQPSKRHVTLPPDLDDPLCKMSLERDISINRLLKIAVKRLLQQHNYLSTEKSPTVQKPIASEA